MIGSYPVSVLVRLYSPRGASGKRSVDFVRQGGIDPAALEPRLNRTPRCVHGATLAGNRGGGPVEKLAKRLD